MKYLYYVRRKNGIHGFLKLAEQKPDFTSREDKCEGEEIHFRTNLTLREAVGKAFGGDVDHQGKRLNLVFKRRNRKTNLLEFTEVAKGDDAVMARLWEKLKKAAEKIDVRHNRLSGYEVNCHTLVFETLENAELKAPRKMYGDVIASMEATENAKMMAGLQPAHP